MTATRSATALTTPKSCVMRSTAVPVVAARLRISSRIWARMVASSAVVGSSQMRSRGRMAIAMAIITRCLSPPDSWCG